eukprot:gene10029-10185_t
MAAKAAVQIGQLLLVNAALILWPASLHPGGLATGQIWMLYAVYMLFFAGGSVYRLLRYGELATRAKDAQGRTCGYAMLLHSAPTALFAVAVCIMYYSVRTRLEQAVLREAFGETYDQYEKSTKMFVPFVW